MYENAARVPVRAMEMKAINARRIAAKEVRCASEQLWKDCIEGGRRRSQNSCAATLKSNSHLFADCPFGSQAQQKKSGEDTGAYF